MNRLYRYIPVLLLVLHGSLLTAAENRIVITGSSTLAPLVLEIGRRFEQQNPGLRVDVQTGGSTRGIVDARSGLADIGMISRALKQGEVDLKSFQIAVDGIGMIVHASNPIRELSNDQIRAVFTGKVRNWRELGGADLPITVVNKAEGRSTLELFLEYFSLRNSQIAADVIIGDNQQGLKTVAGNRGAIGYVSIGAVEYEAARGVPVRQLSMQGIEASVENVRAGVYPLSRPLNLILWSSLRGRLLEFIDFARSPVVDDLIERQFFVPPSR